MEVIRDKESKQVAILMSEDEASVLAGTLMCIPWRRSDYGEFYIALYTSIAGTFNDLIKPKNIRTNRSVPPFLLRTEP